MTTSSKNGTQRTAAYVGAAVLVGKTLMAAASRARAKGAPGAQAPRSGVLARRGRFSLRSDDVQAVAWVCAWAARYRVTVARYQDLESSLAQAVQSGTREEFDMIASFVRYAQDARRRQAAGSDPAYQDALRRDAFNTLLELQATMTTGPNALVDWTWRLSADQPAGSPPPFEVPGQAAGAHKPARPLGTGSEMERQLARGHSRIMSGYASQDRRAGRPPSVMSRPVFGESPLATAARAAQLKLDTLRWGSRQIH
jgi:hypothetical protein